MKRDLLILFLFLTLFGFSQNKAAGENFYNQGNDAADNKNYILAEEKFLEGVKFDSLNRNIWFNLAAVQIELGKENSACECFDKGRKLGDSEANKKMKIYCNDFINKNYVYYKDVDIKPFFEYKNKIYPLFVDDILNKKYISLFTRELQSSKIISKYQKGKLILSFTINENGKFIGLVLRDGGREFSDIVKEETLNIFENLVIYKAAQKNEKNVTLWEYFLFTIDFK